MNNSAVAHLPEYWILKASATSLPSEYYSVAMISDFTTKEFLITEPNMIVGRDPSCAQILIPGARVSRQHAQLQVFDEGLFVRDLGSVNGTFVNGVQITEGFVASGDVISFDHVSLTVSAPQEATARGINQRTLKAQKSNAERKQFVSEPAPSKSRRFFSLLKVELNLLVTACLFFFLGLSIALIID